MKRTNLQIWLYALGITLAVLPGCVTKVLVPPKVNLHVYDKIGMIEFSANAEGNLRQFVTEKFLEITQSSQPGVRILELGDQEGVLKSIQRERLDLEAIRAIGRKYGVDAVITGRLDVTGVKPKVGVSSLLTSMSVRADVEASLSARLWETESGVTRWANSASGEESVAHVHVVPHGPAHFGAGNPEDAYGRLVWGLVTIVTMDFRAQYERR